MLKIKTVIKLIEKWDKFTKPVRMNSVYHFYEKRPWFSAGGLTLSIYKPTETSPIYNRIIARARHRSMGNVHIDTYFSYPKTKKEFQKIVEQVERVYFGEKSVRKT